MRIKKDYEQKIKGAEKGLRMAAAFFTAAVISLCCPFVSLADATGTISVESAKIRGSADTDSNVLGSVSRGATVVIQNEVTDASGALWYQIYVDANTTGYVRADLVSKEAGSGSGASQAVSEGGTDSAGQTDAPAGTSSPAETAMDAQYASVSVEAALVRSAPSTNDSLVERLPRDTQVTVTGQSNGSSDGKVWYYITFTGADGTQKTGFVRSDLITLGDMVPVPEEQPAPEEPADPEPQETFSQDYEVVFKDGEWYLIDHISGGYEQKLQPLLDANQFQNDTMEEDARKLVRQRIAIVVLGVLAAVLLIAVIIMAIKLRDAYYEDYDEDEDEDDEDEDYEDEDEDEDEETPVKRRKRAGEEDPDEDYERTSRRSREQASASRRSVRGLDTRKEQETEQRAKPGTKRKAKNFLLDDDDFEFEFLNMDDKDL